MKALFKPALPLSLLTAFLVAPLQAADLSAHEHGVAQLTLAQDGHEVSVHFKAAADSVIGYEYAPRNDKEREALHHADEVLQHPERWLSFPAGCELESRDVLLPFAVADHHDEHDDHHEAHDHDEQDHDKHADEHGHEAHEHDKHGDEHQDEHGHDKHHDEEAHHDHDHDHDYESGHADVEASYTFHCDDEQTSPATLKLFSQLPYLEELRIEAVSERRVTVTEREGDGNLEW